MTITLHWHHLWWVGGALLIGGGLLFAGYVYALARVRLWR